MSNRFSNSSIDKYNECSLCYRLHYLEGIRPVRTKSALVFGSSLDAALNHLLLTKNLKESIDIFENEWLKTNWKLIDFSKSDLDQELLTYFSNEIKTPNDPSWYSLYFKGRLFIEQYYKEVLPKIKEVIAIQEPVSLKNDDGDEIAGFLDMIVQWEDGKTYLLDNKSSSVTYEQDSARTGQQLPIYHYLVKEKYKLDGVGYIVLNKKINKNKVKKCKECGTINEGSHKTCNKTVETPHLDKEHGRCGGEFEITINPSVDIQYIFDKILPADEQRVIDKFDEVNYNVSNGYFATEHSEKRNKFYQWCPYHDYTETNPNFIKLEKK